MESQGEQTELSKGCRTMEGGGSQKRICGVEGALSHAETVDSGMI